MDNKAIAGILYETADLLEIDGAGFFSHSLLPQRRRSHRSPDPANRRLDSANPKRCWPSLALAKACWLNMQEMFKEGKLSLHTELLKKYRPIHA